MSRVGSRAERAAAPVATPGLLLDDRYRLDQVRAEHRPGPTAPTVLWRAVDVPLDRRVAVLLIGGLTRKAHSALVAAAARASRVTDGRFARVLDVGTIDLATGTTTWIATEWVEAPSLAATVRTSPLAPEVAAEVVRQCAEALAAAARVGCHHLRLHPDQVLLPAAEVPRITGLEVAAALHGVESDDPDREDARLLGALLYAGRTGRWPLAGHAGLPPGDRHAAPPRGSRGVRGGVGRAVDEVTRRALSGSYADAASVARALAVLPSRPLDAPAPDGSGRFAAWRPWAWRLIPPLVVAAIGVAGWSIGSDLGRVPTATQQQRAAVPPAHASAPGSGHASLVWRHPPRISSFDPEGDGVENDDAVGLAVDRDPTTAWETARYRGDPRFGGLKSGVGLLLDLRRPVAVRVAELALTTAGADVEIRAGDTRPTRASDLPVVAERSDAGAHLRLDLAKPTRARWWLLWFTKLPRTSAGDYQAGVVELALLG